MRRPISTARAKIPDILDIPMRCMYRMPGIFEAKVKTSGRDNKDIHDLFAKQFIVRFIQPEFVGYAEQFFVVCTLQNLFGIFYNLLERIRKSNN